MPKSKKTVKKTAKNGGKFDGSTAGPGRPKGLQNKITRVAKEVIAGAAEDLGGRERLVKWVKKNDRNEGVFWSVIYPKLLPHDVKVSGLVATEDISKMTTAELTQYIKELEDESSN